MEALGLALNTYTGRILITGHTDFKAGWLTLWLRQLGAPVLGIGLPSETSPSLFEAANIAELIEHRDLDIRDAYWNQADNPLVATARAGNVIGGGDWAEDRLVPDLVRAAVNGNGVR